MADTPRVESAAAAPRTFAPSSELASRAHIGSIEQYRKMYDRSIGDPDGFWAEIADGFFWKQKWSKIREFDFTECHLGIKYFLGAKTNITYNCTRPASARKTRRPDRDHVGRQRAR